MDWAHNVVDAPLAQQEKNGFLRFKLDHSDLSVHCASIASFQTNGRLHDTTGIQPDILVPRPPEYYVQEVPDTVLQRAIELLTIRSREN